MLPHRYSIRLARRDDVPALVALLSDDQLGKTREAFSAASGAVNIAYYKAFNQILSDKNNELLVLENNMHQVIGTLQITYMTTLTFQGATRAQLESVRIKSEYRGKKLGAVLVQNAISRAKERNCRYVQLTTNKLRTEAFDFYQKLGFTDSHIGFKLDLHQRPSERVTKIFGTNHAVMFPIIQNVEARNAPLLSAHL